MTESKDKKAPVETDGQQPTAKGQQPKANSQPPTAKEPTAAEVYDKLVHTDIAGCPEKKIIEHKQKCVESLAAKRAAKRKTS